MQDCIPVMVKLAGVITRNNPSCSVVSVMCCFPPFCFGDVLRERYSASVAARAWSACLERVLLPVVDILESLGKRHISRCTGYAGVCAKASRQNRNAFTDVLFMNNCSVFDIAALRRQLCQWPSLFLSIVNQGLHKSIEKSKRRKEDIQEEER